MPNEKPKLKSCPYCGGEAAYCSGYITDDRRAFGVGIWCSKCDASIKREIPISVKNFVQYVDEMRNEVIEAWNRRTKDAE